jgi:hypothetical protein
MSRFAPARLTPISLTPWDRIRKKLSNGEIAVKGDQWPMLLYADQEFDPDEPWSGLFRNKYLVWASHLFHYLRTSPTVYSQAFKHIFTSPSSVEKESKATRSGNARIHGMTRVTKASIAYIATQVRTLLRSSPSNFSLHIFR